MAFSNSIALATKYAPILDEVYKRASLTSNLDIANNLIKWDGADTVKLFTTSMNGLGDYDRNTGYTDGSITASWGTYQLTQDRNRRFLIDTMDNDETLGMELATTMGEFIRTRVVPEVDAYRFAKYATAAIAGTMKATADITPGTTDVPGLIETAEEALGDAEVPVEGRILYISENAYRGLKSKITRVLANENGVNHEIEVYDGMKVVRVPKNRFATSIDLYDGTSVGETDGGYIPTVGGYYINFLIVEPSAVRQVVKHVEPKLINPAANQTADGWLAAYRLYHDAFVLDNKADGIYCHYAATAIS